jgi:aspartate/methionine/tyrosine aminotransferase
MDSGMFYGIQKGAVAALQLDNSWFVDLNKVYTSRRELIFELAEQLKCTFARDSVGLFVWAKLPNDIKSSEQFIDEILYNKHIFITPGTIFGSQGEGYIRFSLCVKEEKIKEAIARFDE